MADRAASTRGRGAKTSNVWILAPFFRFLIDRSRISVARKVRRRTGMRAYACPDESASRPAADARVRGERLKARSHEAKKGAHGHRRRT